MQKYIYKIKNLINGKEYYGQTVHPEKRWWEHRRKAITHADSYPIHLAIAKYGEENFSFELLEKTEDYDEEEKCFIRENNSRVPNGYNVAEGGSSYVSYGQENARNTVRDADVPKIVKDLKENKLTDRQIAKKYNSTDKIISDINHGRTHRIDGEKYPLRVKRGSQKMTEKQADEIKDLLRSTDLSYNEIARRYGVTKGTVYQINRGTNFRRDKDDYPIRKAVYARASMRNLSNS